MRKLNNKKDIFLLSIATLMVLVFFISAVCFVASLIQPEDVQSNRSQYEEKAFIKYDGKEYVLRDGIETYLVMGLDKFSGEIKSDSYNNDRLADFIMLIVVDKNNSTYSAVQLNRDTMAEVNILGVSGGKVGSVTQQLSLAHTYGNGKKVSCRNVADSVSKLLYNINIDDYASVTMDAIPILNDMVGGVEVTVEEDFTGVDNTLIKGEKVTLLGEHALNYVRARYGLVDSTNETRMQRQREYLNALLNKTKTYAEQDEEFAIRAADAMDPYLVSKHDSLKNMIETLSECEYKGIINIKGEAKIGKEYMEFYPNKDALCELVIELFCEEKK